MRVDWRAELPLWIVILAMFALAAMSWPAAPNEIPVHWDASGAVNGYGGKFEGLLMLPLVAAGVYLVLLFVPRIDPGRANYAQFVGAYNTFRLAVIALLGATYALMLLAIRGHSVDIPTAVTVMVGALFIVMGNLLGKVRPNWFIGIRTPWTLSSKLAWNKTHRLGGRLFIAAGFIMVASAALPVPWNVMVGFGAVAAIGAFVVGYSYFVWRGDPEKIPPSGTMPA